MIAVIDDVDFARDRDLVLRAQAGDDEAFAQLYSRYHRRLIRFASKRVGDFGDAEEIAQETFTRAYRALPGFGGERRFYPWMTVIASRLCIDSLRRSSRVEVGEVEDAGTIDIDFDRLERASDAARVGEAMAKLCDRHREVLELREHEGWSYQRIADHYKVSLGTVEALIWRARRALRREYEGLASILIGLPLIRRFMPTQSANPGLSIVTLSALGTVAALGLTGMAATPPPIAATTVAALAPAHVRTVTVQTALTGSSSVATAPAVVVRPTRVAPPASVVQKPLGLIQRLPGLEAQQAVDGSTIHVDLGVVAIGFNPARVPAEVKEVSAVLDHVVALVGGR
jgi:RNA polymerase sigma-70 factor (ECF subfamily)